MPPWKNTWIAIRGVRNVSSRRKNSRDEPQSRTPPLETSPRGRNERGWPGDSKRSTEGSMKDQTTSIGAQRREGGWGAYPSSVAYDRADCQPRTSRGQSRRCLGLSTACTDRSGDCGVGRTCRHEPAFFPCGRSACHAPGSHPPASVWLFRTSNRALRCGETPPLPEEAHGGSGAVPRSRQGGRSRPVPPRANAIGKAPVGRGDTITLGTSGGVVVLT